MKYISSIAAVVVTLSVSACMQDRGEKEVGGTLLGGAIGALAGSHIGDGTGRLIAVGAGALVGSMIGSEIGRSLDAADRARAAETYHFALETNRTGETSSWINPDTRNSGSYTPTDTYQDHTGRYCREFQQTITVGGQTESAYGTACRQPDGSWQIQSN